MARRRKKREEVQSYNYSQRESNGSVGLSKAALEALNGGTYGKMTSRKPTYTKSEDQVKVAKKVPSLEGMSRSASFSSRPKKQDETKPVRQERKRSLSLSISPELKKELKSTAPLVKTSAKDAVKNVIDTPKKADVVSKNKTDLDKIVKKQGKTTAAKSSKKDALDTLIDKDAPKKETTGSGRNFTNYKLDDKDEELLYKVFDRNRLSSGGNDAIATQLRNDIWHNADKWEEKYGVPLEQIVADYSRDIDKISAQKNAEYGEEHPVLSTLKNVISGGTAEPAVDLETTILDTVAPKSALAEAARNAAEQNRKRKNEIIEGVTSDMSDFGKGAYDIGTGLAERMIEYATPSKLKYLLQFGKTAENKRQDLNERGVEGWRNKAESLISGAVDAALDYKGLESLPILEGLSQSGNIGKEILGRTLIGGGEMALTNLIEQGADRLLSGDKSVYNQTVADLMAQGMSEEEAKKQANMASLGELGQSALSGALLSNAMGLSGRAAKKVLGVPQVQPDDVVARAAAQQAEALETIRRMQEQLPENSQPGMEKLDAVPETPINRAVEDTPTSQKLQQPMEKPVDEDVIEDVLPEINTRQYSPDELSEIDKYVADRAAIREEMSKNVNPTDLVAMTKLNELRAEGKAMDAEMQEKYPELFDDRGKFVGVPEITEDAVNPTNIDNSGVSQYNANKAEGGAPNDKQPTDNLQYGTGENITRNGQADADLSPTGRTDEAAGMFGRGDSGLSGEPSVTPEIRQKMTDSNIPDYGLRRTTDAKRFSQALDEGRKLENNSHGVFVSAKSPEEVQEILDNGGKVFLTDDNTAGLIVTKDGDIEGVFNNTRLAKSLGKTEKAFADLMTTAVANGGNKLDRYGPFLTQLYASVGFEPVAGSRYLKDKPWSTEMDSWKSGEAGKKGIANVDDINTHVYVSKLRDGWTVDDVIEAIKTGSLKEYADNLDLELDSVNKNLPEKYRNLPEDDEYGALLEYRDSLMGNNSKITEPDVNSPHKKTSEAYTNTGKKGGGWIGDEYKKYTDPEQFQYEDVSEEESVNNAINMRQTEGREGFLNRVMDRERLSGSEIDGLMMEWRDLTAEARNLEKGGGDAQAKWDDAVRVFRKVQEQSSSNAQALQALAKWSRNTPEGMLAHAENLLNGRTQIEKSKTQKLLEKYGKSYKKFQFSDDFIKDFLREAESIQELDPDSAEANRRMAELGKLVNRQLKPSLGEKVTSILMDNMLGNFRTLITRNAGGNVGLNLIEQTMQRPLAAALDTLVSKKTGKRTQAGLSGEGLAEYISGFTKGLKDEWGDLKSGLHTARTGENTIDRAMQANRHVFKEGGIMDKWDSLIKNGLSVGDRPFYEAVYKQTLGDYQRLRSTGKMGDLVQKLSDDQFNEYAETAAKMNALAAVYQNNSKLSDALLGFKRSIGDLSRGMVGVDVLSQFSMPFVKTPANVVNVGIDYSPLGLVRNAVKTGKEIKADAFDQNRFVNEASRNILGTAGMLGAGALAKKEVLSGAYSDDKDEKQAQKEAGEQEYALNLPNGYQMDIGWLPVVGSNAVAAAAAYNAAANEEGNLLSDLATGAKAGGKTMFDQSMFQGLQRLMGTGESYNSDEGIVGNMMNVVKQGIGQLIPSLARQAGQVTDTYQRDVSNSNKGMFGLDNSYDINTLLNNLPVVREHTLAPKVETTGELSKQNQGRNVGMKVLENMILPGKITKVEYSRLNEEAKRLKEDTTSADAYMPKITRKNFDTAEHTLTNDEWVEAEQKYYKGMTDAGTKIIDSDAYKNADSDAQVELLKDTYNAIKSGVQHEYNGKNVSGAAKAYVDAGGGEKGVEAAVNSVLSKAAVAETGLSPSTKAAKEVAAEYAKGNVEKAQQMAQQAADDYDAAKAAGYTDTDGNVRLQDYRDLIDSAGNGSEKMRADLPKLKELGADHAAYHVYANAVQEIPSVTPTEFVTTYNAINTDKSNKLTQKEMTDYLNSHFTGADVEKATQIFNAYNDGSWVNKKDVKKKLKWNGSAYEMYY